MKIRSIALGICVCAFTLSNVSAGTIIVTTTADSGAGSLRNAITAATSGDTIQFDPALNGQTITLTSAKLAINQDITINGPGATQLTVKRSTATGTPIFRIFHIAPSRTVAIDGITISNGVVQGNFFPLNAGGGIYNDGATLTITDTVISGNSAGFGGGIFSDATNSGGALLMISTSTLSGNSADTSGGAIYNHGPGDFIPFSVFASVVLDDSTVSDNSATFGGGILSNGGYSGFAGLAIQNSTISGNTASQNGGAIYNFGEGEPSNALVLLRNSTMSGNSTGGGGGAIFNDADGNSTFVTVVQIENTILKTGASGGNIVNDFGYVGSAGYNISNDDAGGYLIATGDQIDVDPMLGPLQDNGGPTFTHDLLIGSPALNAGNPTFTPPPDYDQRGPGFPRVRGGRIDIGSVEVPTTAQFRPRLLNISTRLKVLTGDNALIGGFIVSGTASKRTIVRAIGPSLTDFGVFDALVDPTLELHGPNGFSTIMNDNWRDIQEAEIAATGLAPSDDLESAIVAFLPPGAYTAILRGASDGIGVGLVEGYDLDPGANSELANISTRGFVDSGDNVMIGGFIVSNGSFNASVLIRAIGPSLTGAGVPNALTDPTLELHDSNGATIAENDDWRDTQEAEIEATGIPPTDDRESAILQDLTPGAYTAILRGKNNTTGIALVEAYQLAGASTPRRVSTPTAASRFFGTSERRGENARKGCTRTKK